MIDDLFPICLRAILSLTYRRPHSPRLHRLRNEKCQSYHHCPRLPSTPHRLARAFLSATLAITQTMNECMSQGVDIHLRVLQTHLSLISNFPSIHGRLLANVRDFVLCSLVSSPLPIRDLYAGSCPQIILMFSIPSSYSYYSTTPSPCSSKRSSSALLSCLPSAAPMLTPSCSSNSPNSKRRPKSSLHHSSNLLLARLTPVSLGLGG
jgi:hypothetical protein